MSMDSFGTELLYSDLSSAGLDLVTNKALIWITNSFAHFSFGWIGYSFWHHKPYLRQYWLILVALYIALQIIQMFSPGDFFLLLADGVWDVLCPYVGWLLAEWVTMRNVPEVDRDAGR